MRRSSRSARLRVEREGEAKIGVERALVELVEQHGRDAFERGIVEDHAREHALGHDLDAGARRDETLKSHAQANRLADLLAERRGHAVRRGAGREAPRLQHEDAAALCPCFAEKREGNARRLARAGRRDEDGPRMGLQRRPQPRQGVLNGQGLGARHARLLRKPGREGQAVRPRLLWAFAPMTSRARLGATTCRTPRRKSKRHAFYAG